jgi:hypothetical protein
MLIYSLAIVLTAFLLYFMPSRSGKLAEVCQINWASFLLAVSIVVLEVGFLLVYHSGWNIGLAAVLANVIASLILLQVAVFVFKDKLDRIDVAGDLTCLAGPVMSHWKR